MTSILLPIFVAVSAFSFGLGLTLPLVSLDRLLFFTETPVADQHHHRIVAGGKTAGDHRGHLFDCSAGSQDSVAAHRGLSGAEVPLGDPAWSCQQMVNDGCAVGGAGHLFGQDERACHCDGLAGDLVLWHGDPELGAGLGDGA